ncbi:signal peptidase II [Leifsonia sp. 71-9]|uniref:signal peptidase II n=1 Tax=Leifsonia sp. 71-9 TaxID=1895934 RepID=UPI000A6FAE57|nr:signal peptidase II [Leifsonia sp. 71-9]
MTTRNARPPSEAVAGGVAEASSRRAIGRRPPRALGIAVAVAALGLILDQATKMLAVAQLSPGSRVPIIGDLLSLSLVHNPGAAFSIGSGAAWVFTVIGVLAAAVTIGIAVRLRGIGWGIALGLILGGAIGNLVDRLMKPPSFGQGHVTDFIAYGDLFIGNMADVLVVSGVALLCLILIVSSWRPKPHAPQNADSEHGSLHVRTDTNP